MINYKNFKEAVKIKSGNRYSNEDAYITHYLQNIHNGAAASFKERAVKYIDERSIKEESKLILTSKTRVDWGVPFPPPLRPKFKFIDLFAGIGGFRLAMQEHGGKCVFSSEIDNSAKRTYESNFGEYPFGDLRDFTNSDVTDKELGLLIPDHDILTGGFPCQPFSLAGVSARNSLGLEHGFNDKKQGNLFYDIARVIEVKKPKAVFLENVKNFRGHDKGNTFQTVEDIMIGLGYTPAKAAVINSKTVVPQKRERFYMVFFRNAIESFEYPKFEGEAVPLLSVLEEEVEDKYTISDKLWEGHKNRTQRNLKRGTGFTAFEADLDQPAKTLVARYGKDGKECLIPQDGLNPRKLTPRECARLQGFPEEYVLPVSDAAAYRQFGNSVAVPVIKGIAGNIVNTLTIQNLI